MDDTTRPRVYVEVTPEQKAALDRHLGPIYGLRTAVFTVIIEDLLNILEGDEGKAFISALVNRQLGLSDFIRTNTNG